MNDIETREDIELLVGTFYKSALESKVIGYIFTEVAQLDLTTHIPIISNFWESVLLGTHRYSRNTMRTHLDLNQKTALSPKHFETWLALFNQTVDSLFRGKCAEKAKERALSIATVMQIKIHSSNNFLLDK